MGRAPCCDKANVKKGPWSPEEDAKLKDYIQKHGTGGNWISLPQKAGLKRCGKSCRLRWLNYLRPNIRHGDFSADEDRIICSLFANIGSRWSIIAAQLPGRTDNDIKNYWNTKLKTKLIGMAATPLESSTTNSFNLPNLDPSSLISSPSATISAVNYYNTPPTSFTPYDQNESFSMNSSSISPSGLQIHHDYMHSMSQFQEGLMKFGEETSPSSSDGSSITNQAGYVKVEKDVYGIVSNHTNVDVQDYLCYGVDHSDQKVHKSYGFYGENPLDYSLEEIKNLISTNHCSDIVLDENNTAGEVVYY